MTVLDDVFYKIYVQYVNEKKNLTWEKQAYQHNA
jgi:hypothetical protein